MSRPLPRPTALLPLAAIALLLAACTASPKLPQDAGDVGEVDPSAVPTIAAPEILDMSALDVCTLLTQSEAETLVAWKLTEPVKTANADTATCTYTSDPNGPTRQVEIYVGSGAESQLNITKNGQKTLTQPTGLGDEAWQDEEGMWIYARTGTTWVSIGLVSLEDASIYVTPLQTAMAVVLARL